MNTQQGVTPMSAMHNFACPNCRAPLPPEAAECPACGALFNASADWKPVRRSSLGPAQAMSWGDFFLFPVKLLLSGVCLALGVAVLFGGDLNWGKLLAAAFFLALGGLTWVMMFPARVRRVLVGLLMVAVGVAFLHIAVLAWDGTAVYPKDCSTLRRTLGCSVENLLHAVGGTLLVGAFRAAIGIASVVVGVQVIRGRVKHQGLP